MRGFAVRVLVPRLLAVAVLAAFAWTVPGVRRTLIRAVVTWDAPVSEPAPLPGGTGPGLPRTPRTRVVLIDGLTAAVARTLPTWRALCGQGLTLTVEVGFPTVSLPVEVSLWTGLTQQQTGVVYRSNRPLVPPLGREGIPAQVPGSHAVAEYYGYIVRSLGFAQVEPAADPTAPARDAAPAAWKLLWYLRAIEAVRSPSPLVFVHLLRVDSAGHKHGLGAAYERAAREADELLAGLHALDPGARWFVLSDHGHLAGGGHGGEEAPIRHVEGCITGADITPGRGGLVHVVDISRALADSVGATLTPPARGRPLSAALATPLTAEQGLPPIALGTGALAILGLALAIALTGWGVRRWWLGPWWFVIGLATLIAVAGLPSLSTPMIYKPAGRDMYLLWLPALALAAVGTWTGLRHTTLVRVLVAQLAVPLAAAAGALTIAGAWPALLGAEVAPVVPRFTAWASPLLLIAAHGAAAVALGVLASVVRRSSDPAAASAPPRSAPADA